MAESNTPICFEMCYFINMKGSGSSVSSRWSLLFHRQVRATMLYAEIVYFGHCQLWVEEFLDFKILNAY